MEIVVILLLILGGGTLFGLALREFLPFLEGFAVILGIGVIAIIAGFGALLWEAFALDNPKKPVPLTESQVAIYESQVTCYRPD